MGVKHWSWKNSTVYRIKSMEAPSRKIYHACVTMWVTGVSESERREKWRTERPLMDQPQVFWRRLRSMPLRRRR